MSWRSPAMRRRQKASVAAKTGLPTCDFPNALLYSRNFDKPPIPT
jgi:hypothetical protein